MVTQTTLRRVRRATLSANGNPRFLLDTDHGRFRTTNDHARAAMDFDSLMYRDLDEPLHLHIGKRPTIAEHWVLPNRKENQE